MNYKTTFNNTEIYHQRKPKKKDLIAESFEFF